MNSFAIDPHGHMSICVISHQATYDIRKGNLREGWEGFLQAVRKKTRSRPSKCQECKIQTLCGMCPAMGELENGDPESPVDFHCQVAHLRAMAVGIDVPTHGKCECCKDGIFHSSLMDSAERITDKVVDVGAWRPAPKALLPVLNQVTAGGCSSCVTSR